MNNIEVGEYIRYINGSVTDITKVEDISIIDDEIWFKTNGLYLITEADIIKHSFNIIDLIEVGDYVNGYEVMNIYKPRDIWEPIEIEIDSKCTRCFLASEIKSIVTKEQFKEMEYRINE